MQFMKLIHCDCEMEENYMNELKEIKLTFKSSYITEATTHYRAAPVYFIAAQLIKTLGRNLYIDIIEIEIFGN